MEKIYVTLVVSGALLLLSSCHAEKLGEHDPTQQGQNGDKRIVGGKDAEKGEFPWLVVFKYVSDSHIFCGGSIIDASWILTAAHCVTDLPDDFFIVAGEYSLKNDDDTEQKRIADQIFKHEEYDKEGNSENDIAVIKLDLPLQLNDDVDVVDIPDGPTPNGTLCTISGWGARSDSTFDPDFPDILQKVEVPVVTDEVCQEGCDDMRCVIEETMMCAGYEQGGKDSCQGDSGGPLVCSDDDGRTYEAGIVSTGYGCALPELYGIYTEVWFYKDWINAVQDRPSVTTEFPSGSSRSALHPLLLSFLAFYAALVL